MFLDCSSMLKLGYISWIITKNHIKLQFFMSSFLPIAYCFLCSVIHWSTLEEILFFLLRFFICQNTAKIVLKIKYSCQWYCWNLYFDENKWMVFNITTLFSLQMIFVNRNICLYINIYMIYVDVSKTQKHRAHVKHNLCTVIRRLVLIYII